MNKMEARVILKPTLSHIDVMKKDGGKTKPTLYRTDVMEKMGGNSY